MEEVKYLFIDGAYLRHLCEAKLAGFFGEATNIEHEAIKATLNARKAFYYDCLDRVKRKDESRDEFDERVAIQDSKFSRIRSIPGFHVRLGELTGAKRRSQKEVDVLLAVDMLNHAIRRNMTTASLLAGDRDFRPVVESLVQMGVWVELVSGAGNTSSALREAADSWERITVRRLYDWSAKEFKSKHTCPAESPLKSYMDLGRPVRLASLEGATYDLLQCRDQFHMVIPGEKYLTSRDRGVLERYVEAEYGDVKWEDSNKS